MLIGASDPAAMLSFTAQCRKHQIPFAADTSQQLASLDGEQVRDLVDGAAYLFCNEYEASLTTHKTGWTDDETHAAGGHPGNYARRCRSAGGPGWPRPGYRPAGTRRAAEGADRRRGRVPRRISCRDRVGLSLERAAQVGNMVAVHALEATGPQDYELKPGPMTERFAAAYGPEAERDLIRHYS